MDHTPERRRRVKDRVAAMKRAMLDAQRLAGLRDQRGLTQQGVADALHVSQTTSPGSSTRTISTFRRFGLMWKPSAASSI